MFLIALGSNIPGVAGEPRHVLEAALADLEANGVRIVARSSWWRTPAHPPGAGPDFVNAAAEAEAPLAPEAMLARLHEVEASLGRLRPHRWAPRVCDLDLLAAGETVLPDRATVEAWMALPEQEQAERAPDRLILPHPRMHQRAFVLAPLVEIRPDWRHPVLGRSARQLLAALPGEAQDGMLRL